MANVSLKLKMKDGSDYEITPLNGLNSVESKSQSTTQPKEIFYGVVPNTGSFEVTDYNGKIRKKIEADEIDYSNTQAELDFNGQVINSHITTDSDYNEDTVFSAEMTDTLANWDNINFAGRALTDKCSLYLVLENIIDTTLAHCFFYRKEVKIKEIGETGAWDETIEGVVVEHIFYRISGTIPVQYKITKGHSYFIKIKGSDRGDLLPTTYNEIQLYFPSNSHKRDFTPTEANNIDISLKIENISNESGIANIDLLINTYNQYCTINEVAIYDLTELGLADKTETELNALFGDIPDIAAEHTQKRIVVLNGASSTETTIADYLKNILVSYPYLPASTLREALTSVCEVAQLQIVGTPEGSWEFLSARPLMAATDAVLKIPPSMQFDRPQKDVILKNKYDGVELDAIEVTDAKEEGDTVYTYSTSNIAINESDKVKKTGTSDKIHQGAGRFEKFGTSNYVYKTFAISFYSISNLGTETVTKVYDKVDDKGNANISCSVTYQLKQGKYSNTNGKKVTKETYGSGEIPTRFSDYFTFNGVLYGGNEKFDLDIPDNSNLKTATVTKDDNGYYHVELTVLVYNEQYDYRKATHAYGSPNNVFYYDGDYNEYTATQLNVTFKGDKRVVSFDITKSASSANVASAKTVAKLNHNTLLQTGTTYKGTPIADIIRENVLDDYKNGISTATLNCTCDDVYTTKGTLALNFSEGRTLQVGDIVRLDKSHSGVSYYTKQDGSPQHFKVTGVTYGYDGYPYQNLELQALSNDVTHIYTTKVDDHYEVGDGTNFALTSYNSIIPKEININDFIGGEVTKVNANAFFNSNTYTYPTLDLLVFDSEVVLDGYSLTNIANKIVFNGNITSTTSDLPAIVFMAGQPFYGEAPSTPIVEFGEHVNIVGSPNGFLFGGAVFVGSGIQNEGILVFKNTGTITLNIREANNIAVKLTIYADSSSVTTYDWASKNITATIKPLSEYKE